MKPSKYRAVRTVVDGVTFASKREAARYQELLLMQKGGLIEGLECQPRYPIEVNGHKICTYVADFTYLERRKRILEDVKGVKTPVYRLKYKLMQACYGITIREVK